MGLTDADRTRIKALAERNKANWNKRDPDSVEPHDPDDVLALLEENDRLLRGMERMAQAVEADNTPTGHFTDCPAFSSSGACDCGAEPDALPFLYGRDPGFRNV